MRKQEKILAVVVVAMLFSADYAICDTIVSTASALDVNSKKIPPTPEGFTEDVTKEATIAALTREVQSLHNQINRHLEFIQQLNDLDKMQNEELVKLEKRIDALVKIDEIRGKQIDMLMGDTTKTPTLEEMAEKPKSKNSFSNLEPKTETSSAIESQIDGEFNGWEGETIFKLTNGQIWQQSSYDYTYHYAFRPKVVIYKVNGRYKMTVEGVKNAIMVMRIK